MGHRPTHGPASAALISGAVSRAHRTGVPGSVEADIDHDPAGRSRSLRAVGEFLPFLRGPVEAGEDGRDYGNELPRHGRPGVPVVWPVDLTQRFRVTVPRPGGIVGEQQVAR